MVTITPPFMPNLRMPCKSPIRRFNANKTKKLFDKMPDDVKGEIISFLQPVMVSPMTQINISYLYLRTLTQNYSIKYWSQRIRDLPKTLKNFNKIYEFVLLSEQLITEKININNSGIFCDVRFANMALYGIMDNFRDDCDYNLLLCMHYRRHKRNKNHMRYHYQSDAKECHCLMRSRALVDTVYKVNAPSIQFIVANETQRQSLMDSTREIFVNVIHTAIYEFYRTYGVYTDQNKVRHEWLYDNERKILRIMLFLLAQ